MAEFPALPLWTDAYLGDTTHLTTIEHGAYLLLLMTAWRTSDCCLPDDDRLLARYARLNRQQWPKIRPILEPFFTIKNGVWRQGRLTDERAAIKQHREKQSEKGKAGAQAKALKRLERDKAAAKSGVPSGQAEDEAQVQPDASSHLLTHLHSSEDKSSGAGAPAKAIFDLGVSILTGAGCSAKEARSLVGKWRKARGEKSVREAFEECIADEVSEPVAWLTRRLERTPYVSDSGYEYRGDLDQVIRESERRADWSTHWRAVADKRKAEEKAA